MTPKLNPTITCNKSSYKWVPDVCSELEIVMFVCTRRVK